MSEINPTLTGRRAEAARLWAETDWPEMASFLGPNADRFAKAWSATHTKALEKGAGISLSWCWPAFFFGFAWFLYRRMWAMGVVLLAIPVALGFILPGRGGAPAIGVITAIYAKSLLTQYGVTRIAKIKAAGGGYDEIAAAGGVSVAGGVVGGVIIAVFLTAIVAAAVMVGPGQIDR